MKHHAWKAGISFLSICAIVFSHSADAQHLELLSNHNYVMYRGTDVWEYIDETSGRIYAVCGDDDGLSHSVVLIDVTIPDAPFLTVRIYNVPGFDVKVWDHFIYSVNGGSSGGAIVDIGDVKDPQIVGQCPGYHNIFIDTSGFLYSGGSIYDLNTYPQAPELVYQADFYSVHDMTVRENLMICCHGADGTFVYDITDRTQPEVIMQFTEPTFVYHHQGDFSADRNFLFVTDELASSKMPDISIWDISDRDNPEYIGGIVDEYTIAHNLYIRGDYMFVSHYTAGLKVFDISNPFETQLIDTYVTGDSAKLISFSGAWGVYPSPVTGNIYVTDWDNGLFVFRLVDNITATHQLQNLLHIRYIPNPARHRLSVSWQNLEPGQHLVTLYNANGREVIAENQRVYFENEVLGHTFNVEELSPGIYFIFVKSPNYFGCKKVLVAD